MLNVIYAMGFLQLCVSLIQPCVCCKYNRPISIAGAILPGMDAGDGAAAGAAVGAFSGGVGGLRGRRRGRFGR